MGASVVLVGLQVSVLGSYLPPVPGRIGGVGVGVGLSGADCTLFLAPVFKNNPNSFPPQTIISLPVHTAVWPDLAVGASAVLVATQMSVAGLYLPPVFKLPELPDPPQMIISLPVHTDVWPDLGEGALAVLVAVQVSVVGLYLAPVSE
jgi:hypothetical protein